MTACQEVLQGLETGQVSKGDVEEAKTKVQEVQELFSSPCMPVASLKGPHCHHEAQAGAVLRKTQIDLNRSCPASVLKICIAGVFAAL